MKRCFYDAPIKDFLDQSVEEILGVLSKDRWQNINQEEGRAYQLNAYRALLTRARQGMVICVPEGNPADDTRKPEFYDGTYKYLKSLGIKLLE